MLCVFIVLCCSAVSVATVAVEDTAEGKDQETIAIIAIATVAIATVAIATVATESNVAEASSHR